MIYFWYFAVILIGYLIGSLNFSIIIGKVFYKKDVRKFGSKNAGATNTLRTLGKLPALFVFLLDTLKAVGAYFLAMLITGGNLPVAYLSAAAASLGHNYPIFFGFKGGKGVTVSLGAVCCFNPIAGLLALTIGVVVIAISKYVSFGSMFGAICGIPLMVVLNRTNEHYVLTLVLTVVLVSQVIFMHRKNIVSLIRKEERKITDKKH